MLELGASLDSERRRAWSIETLDTLIHAVLGSVVDDTAEHWQGPEQTYRDLCLLLQICRAWDGSRIKSAGALEDRIAELRLKVFGFIYS